MCVLRRGFWAQSLSETLNYGYSVLNLGFKTGPTLIKKCKYMGEGKTSLFQYFHMATLRSTSEVSSAASLLFPLLTWLEKND